MNAKELVAMWRIQRAEGMRTHANRVRKSYTTGELARLCKAYADDLDRAAGIIESGGGL